MTTTAKQPEDETLPPFKIGDRVLHGTFGHGTVLSVGVGSAVVVFDTGRHANIRLDFLAHSDKPKPDPAAAN
jgi:hypothetical protein